MKQILQVRTERGEKHSFSKFSLDLLQRLSEVEFQQGKKQLHSLGSQRVVCVNRIKKCFQTTQLSTL